MAAHPEWHIPELVEKTGIDIRYLAAPEQTASDLATKACESLFQQNGIDPKSIDFLLLCTQTPD